MSILFKKILGQSVVHPERTPAPAGDDSTASAEKSNTNGKAQNGPENGPAVPSAGSTSRQDPASARAGKTLAHPPRVAPPSGDRRSTSTPARTLLTRLKTCVVLQDMRDTLLELQNSDDLVIALSPEDLDKDIVPLLSRFDEDEDVVNTTMKLLSRITASYDDERCVSDLDERGRRGVRAGFLAILIPQVPLLVTQLKRTHMHFFWSRFYAVQILAHLEEQDPAATSKQLLACHGLGVLVDLLSDTAKDGLLRNETLRLLATLTSTDAEMQTILAFENGFDSLFNLIHQLGDVDSGAQGTVVIECLTIIHNLLRSNKPTGKLFREMGSAQHLVPILETTTTRLRAAQQRQEQAARRSGVSPASSPTAKSAPTAAGKAALGTANTGLYDSLTTTQSTILLMAVSILGCLLRQAEPGAEAEEARRNGMDCGALRPLMSVALSGEAVDDAIRIESLRTVTLFVRGSTTKLVTQEVLDQPVLTLVRSPSSSSASTSEKDVAQQHVLRWSSCRALLEYVLVSDDQTMISASTQLLAAVLENNSACSGALRVTQMLMDGFFESCTANAATADAQTRCGFLFARALLGPGTAASSPLASGTATTYVSAPSASARYYAAHLMQRLLRQPDGTDCVCQPKFHSAPSTEGTLPRLNPALYLTPAVPPTLLNALMCFYIAALQHARAKQGQQDTQANPDADGPLDGTDHVDMPTLSALSQLLLTYLVEHAPSVSAILSEPQWVGMLAYDAGQAQAPSLTSSASQTSQDTSRSSASRHHLRLWSAAVLCQIGLCTPVEPRRFPASRSGDDAQMMPSRAMVLQYVYESLGDPITFFDTLLADLRKSGSPLSQPASDAFASNQRVLYDVALVEQLEAITAAMKALPAPASPEASAAPPPRPLLTSPQAAAHAVPEEGEEDGQQQSAALGAVSDVREKTEIHAVDTEPPAPRAASPTPRESVPTRFNEDALAELESRYALEVAQLRDEHVREQQRIAETTQREADTLKTMMAQEKEEMAAHVSSLEARLHQQAQELEARAEEVADLRASVDALEDQLRSWQQHGARLEVAHQATLTELHELRERQAASETHTETTTAAAAAEAVEPLRRTIESLQETLAATANKQQTLHRELAATTADLDTARARVSQLEQMNEALRSAPAPHAPPAALSPRDDAVPKPDPALLEALTQRDGEIARLLRYVEQLELDQHTLRQDRDDLLLLVGEVDVECASLRGASANPTPSRVPQPSDMAHQTNSHLFGLPAPTSSAPHTASSLTHAAPAPPGAQGGSVSADHAPWNTANSHVPQPLFGSGVSALASPSLHKSPENRMRMTHVPAQLYDERNAAPSSAALGATVPTIDEWQHGAFLPPPHPRVTAPDSADGALGFEQAALSTDIPPFFGEAIPPMPTEAREQQTPTEEFEAAPQAAVHEYGEHALETHPTHMEYPEEVRYLPLTVPSEPVPPMTGYDDVVAERRQSNPFAAAPDGLAKVEGGGAVPWEVPETDMHPFAAAPTPAQEWNPFAPSPDNPLAEERATAHDQVLKHDTAEQQADLFGIAQPAPVIAAGNVANPFASLPPPAPSQPLVDAPRAHDDPRADVPAYSPAYDLDADAPPQLGTVAVYSAQTILEASPAVNPFARHKANEWMDLR